MKDGELHFDVLKESRGWYCVEYTPPIAGYPLAFVQLTILSDSDASDHARITEAMEQELDYWLKRYHVPAMVSAFDATGDLICLDTERPSSHLMGRRNMESERTERTWGVLEDKSLPVLSPKDLRSTYHDIPFRTAEQIRFEAQQDLKHTKRSIRLSLTLLILWLVVIPVTIELLGVANPLIGAIALIYSLWKAFVQLMKLIGKWPENRHEKEQSERKQRMEHYPKFRSLRRRFADMQALAGFFRRFSPLHFV